MKKKEMKSQKVQELTAEELEQANGGNVTIDDILKSTTAILMFHKSRPSHTVKGDSYF